MFKSFQNKEYRPYTCFQKAQYAHPKTCGMTNKIDGRSNKTKKIECTRLCSTLYFLFHSLIIKVKQLKRKLLISSFIVPKNQSYSL